MQLNCVQFNFSIDSIAKTRATVPGMPAALHFRNLQNHNNPLRARTFTYFDTLRNIFRIKTKYVSINNEINKDSMSKNPTPDMDDVIKALAHPVRREMLAWLKDPQKSFPKQEHSFELGVCAGKIFEKADLSQSTISVHLATLQKAGLITSRKVGQWIFYSRNEALIEKFLKRINNEL
jgi:DNA-binding transcriptional ArsR family regulator